MIQDLPALRHYVDQRCAKTRAEQQHIQLPPALSADEIQALLRTAGNQGLTISQKSLEMQIAHEIVSEQYYNRHLRRPYWPGGDSGVTIGIGYDLGYHSPEEIQNDWSPNISVTKLRALRALSGIKGKRAQAAAWQAAHVTISLEAASYVYTQSSLPKYAAQTLRYAPNVHLLPPDAQGAMLSLIYNRGTSVTGLTRREMAVIQQLIASLSVGAEMRHVLSAIADEILAMTRLWEGKGLGGLLRRRHDESDLMLSSLREYHRDELILID